MEIKPKSKREHIIRRYNNVYVLLRKIFNVPKDEMVLNFNWDKNNGELILETIKD